MFKPYLDDDMPRPGCQYRAVFISDLHLGTPGCQAQALLAFLRSHQSEHLYLVGDIIDGWQLRRRWFWPQAHNDVIQKILKRARKGCDWIVANDVSGDVMGGATNSVHIVTAEGVDSLPEMAKEAVARALVERIASAL